MPQPLRSRWSGFRRRLSPWMAGTAGCYVVGVLAVLTLMYWDGDEGLVGTLLLYGPRWIWLAPLAALVPASIAIRPRALPALAVSGLIVAGPIMGFQVPVPWRMDWSSSPGLRMLTCNVHQDGFDPAAFRRLLAEFNPDVVACQEWGFSGEPAEVFEGDGWHVDRQSDYLIASRYPIVAVEFHRPKATHHRTAVATSLESPWGTIEVVNVHPTSIREGFSAFRKAPEAGDGPILRNMNRRWSESAATSRWIAERDDRPRIVAGDFNAPSESNLFQDCWGFLDDAFESAGFGLGHTWFSRWHGLRIDHVLTGPGWKVRRCRVGPDVGSDHRPVLAELVLQNARR